MSLTKVSPALIQVANNVTSTTIGNTTSIPSLTFDASGVIISASNTTVTVANTNITGNITSSQIVPNPVFNGNTTVTNIIVGAGSNTAPSISSIGIANTGIFFPAANNIGFATGGTIRGRWTTDGLCFGSDTAAANALDDYEEGTWTPTVSASAGTITSTVLTNFSYTKIGNTVRFNGFVKVTNTGTGVGSLILSLPFAPANDDWGAAGFEKDVVGYIVGIYGANNTMFLRKYDDSTVIVTNHGIRLGGVYQAA